MDMPVFQAGLNKVLVIGYKNSNITGGFLMRKSAGEPAEYGIGAGPDPKVTVRFRKEGKTKVFS